MKNANALAYKATQSAHELFGRIHQTGAQRHPRTWFMANEHAARAVVALKGRVDDPQLKALVSLVVLRTLDAVIPKEQR